MNATYTCTQCNAVLIGLTKYRAHANSHRNQDVHSSSKPQNDWDNISTQSREAPDLRQKSSTTHDRKGKRRADQSPVADNDSSSVTQSAYDTPPKRSSKKPKQNEPPSGQKRHGGRKKGTRNKPKSNLYSDNVKFFSIRDPLARQLDITNYRKFIFNQGKKVSYRPLPTTAKEELRKLFHSVYKSVTANSTASSAETVRTVIRLMDKKIKNTLVPVSMVSVCYDLEKTKTKTDQLKTDVLICMREQVNLDLEVFYTSFEIAKLEMEYLSLDNLAPDDDPLAVIPKHLREYVSKKPDDLVYNYSYYLKKYPSSSFSRADSQ